MTTGVYSWGTYGKFPAALDGPHSMSVDSEGNLYVGDFRNRQVQKFMPKKDADKSKLGELARMRPRSILMALAIAIASLAGPAVPIVAAQNHLGGHFGFVLPLVTRVNGQTTNISDDFSIGFPMGITVRKSDDIAFDLEIVPGIQNDPLGVSLTVHPGVVWSLPKGWGAGVRMAFDVGAPSWGFTPILNHALVSGKNATLFGEFVLPIRFQDIGGNLHTVVTAGVHIGVGF